MSDRFSLAGTGTSFQAKSSSVFDGLEALETGHRSASLHGIKNTTQTQGKRDERTKDSEQTKKDHVVKDTVAENTFRVPQPVTRAGRADIKLPAHRQQPQKWTKYDLSDVDTSEQSNKAAAFAFLEERRKLREGAMEEEKVSDLQAGKGKVVFNKTLSQDESKPKKKKFKRSSNIVNSNTVSLDFNEAVDSDEEEKDADDVINLDPKRKKQKSRNIRVRTESEGSN